MNSELATGLVLAVALAVLPARSQEETLLMTVLSSRAPGWNNPEDPKIGLFRSTDRGRHWEHRGWREYVRTFYAEEGRDGTVWLACGNGVMRSTDGGATWKITTGWEVTEVLKVRSDPSDPQRVFAATAYGIFRSTDRGEHWERKNSGLGKPFTADLLIDRTEGMRLLAATEHGVYRSVDGGDSWRIAGAEGKAIRCLAQDPLNPGRFWAGSEDDGLFRSDDSGRHWKSWSRGLNHPTVYCLWCDPVTKNVVYAGTYRGGVYKSTDGGEQWKQMGEGLTTPDVHALVGIPGSPETIFAGTVNGGLFQSENGGGVWKFSSQQGGQVWGLSVRSPR